MAFVIKALPFCLLVACAAAQYDGYGYEAYEVKQPVLHHAQRHQEDYDTDFHAHPKYTFDYAVKDPHTGDDKEHWETRDGDKVKGSYTVLETDGTKRVVEYEADDKNGFNAVVHKIGTPHQAPQEYKLKEYREPSYEHEPQYSRYQTEYQVSEDQDGGFIPIVPHFRN